MRSSTSAYSLNNSVFLGTKNLDLSRFYLCGISNFYHKSSTNCHIINLKYIQNHNNQQLNCELQQLLHWTKISSGPADHIPHTEHIRMSALHTAQL